MHGIFSAEETKAIFRRIQGVSDRRGLAEALAIVLGRLSVFDLQRICASLAHEVNVLPSPYREKIRPYFTAQLFGSYYRLMRMQRDGTIQGLSGEIKDIAGFNRYCAMVLGDNRQKDGQKYGGFYYLVSCFTIFVMDEPGHPVDMPFPGGFTVERRGEEYFCPVRDKEKDVAFAICNYCPARQSE